MSVKFEGQFVLSLALEHLLIEGEEMGFSAGRLEGVQAEGQAETGEEEEDKPEGHLEVSVMGAEAAHVGRGRNAFGRRGGDREGIWFAAPWFAEEGDAGGAQVGLAVGVEREAARRDADLIMSPQFRAAAGEIGLPKERVRPGAEKEHGAGQPYDKDDAMARHRIGNWWCRCRTTPVT